MSGALTTARGATVRTDAARDTTLCVDELLRAVREEILAQPYGSIEIRWGGEGDRHLTLEMRRVRRWRTLPR